MRDVEPQSEPPLQRLTSLCAALMRNDDTVVRELLAPGQVDWASLKQVADEHRLTGYLYAVLQARGLDALIAPDFLLHARRIYLQQWSRAGQLLREIERIASALEARGLPFLFFKGPLLSARLYDHLGSRAIHDIDFLIPAPDAMPDYESALAPLGYRRVSLLLLPLSWSRAWLYQLEYRSEAFALEPHWALQSHPSIKLDKDRLWREQATAPTPGGRFVPMLSDEYTLVANLLSIPADLQNASLKLRTYFELHLLWRRFPAGYDWTAFWARRGAERTQRLAGAALVLLQDLFGAAGLEDATAAAPGGNSRRVAIELGTELGTQLLGPTTSEWRRRRLALNLFESPLSLSLLWWSVTLPGRALAHPALTLRRLRWW